MEGARGKPSPTVVVDKDASGPRRRRRGKRTLNLALQGGGAHGAFTWGVLERLLEEPDIEIEGVSATSAGAMNGAMLTSGLKTGGPQEAQRRLRALWERVRDGYLLNQPPWSYWIHAVPPFFHCIAPDVNPLYMAGDVLTRMVSPYQFNPGDVNPLRDILEDLVDFDEVRRDAAPRLYVCATDVRSGRARVFSREEISIEALLASACLPFLTQAVRIDGRDYWDGGYTGNPPIWPLIYECESNDVLIVHINPIVRDETPMDAAAIQNRVNEISFNSNLMGELRAIHTISKLLEDGVLQPGRYKEMRIHAVADPETMLDLSVATKLNPDDRVLSRLYEAGRRAMDEWLQANGDKLGVQSTVDIAADYL